MSMPAATMNGRPGAERAKTPKTNGEGALSIFPTMFIIPDTIPEYLPPTSMGDRPSRRNCSSLGRFQGQAKID